MTTEEAIIVALITAVIAGLMGTMMWAERQTEGRRSRSDDNK